MGKIVLGRIPGRGLASKRRIAASGVSSLVNGVGKLTPVIMELAARHSLPT